MKTNISPKYSFYWFQLPAILFTILIFVNSSFKGIQTINLGFEFQDKVYHFLFYLIYAVFLSRAFYQQNYSLKIREHFVGAAILFGVLYGISDEIHQYFVPGRFMDIGDMIADGLGVVAGTFLYQYFSKKLSNLSISAK